MEGKDLTQGNLLKNMIRFCIPLFITNLLNSMYNLVDGIWVGQLVGDEGVAAVTNCWPITLIASSILSAIAVSASIMVAQRYASTEREKIKDIITPIYIVAILLGIITNGILISTLDIWLKLLNTPVEVFDISKQYLIIYLIGYMFYFLAFTIVESIRATGNSKVPRILLALTNIVDNFNKNPLIEQYKNEGITLGANLNNYSLYISYTSEDTITYEFNYSNLILNINITNSKENITKFNKVYEILIKAIQERINNEFDTTTLINKHLNENINYDGLSKEINENIITYRVDITKKLIEKGSEENGNSTH